jgi:hypothetical protein
VGEFSVTIAGHRVLGVQFELQYKTSVRVLEGRTRILEAIARHGDEFEMGGMDLRIGREGRSRTVTLDANRLRYQADPGPDGEIHEAGSRHDVQEVTRALGDTVPELHVKRASSRIFVQLRLPPPTELHAAVLEAAGRTALFSGALGARPGEHVRGVELEYDAGAEERAVRWRVADDGLVADIGCATTEPEPPYAAILDAALAFAHAVVSSVGPADPGLSERTS